MSKTTRETCYHCNKQFDAAADDCSGDTWICQDCGEALVRDGVIEDGRDYLDSQEREDE